MPIIRGLDLVFADFDARQRQFPSSRNQPLQKFQTINDTVVFGDTVTTTVMATPFQWVVATSTTVEGVWNEQGEWA